MEPLNPQRKFLKQSRKNYKIILGQGSKYETQIIMPLISNHTSQKIFKDNQIFKRKWENQSSQSDFLPKKNVSSAPSPPPLEPQTSHFQPALTGQEMSPKITARDSPALIKREMNMSQRLQQYRKEEQLITQRIISPQNSKLKTNDTEGSQFINQSEIYSQANYNNHNVSQNFQIPTQNNSQFLQQSDMVVNQDRDDVGKLWEKNKSFMCRSPPSKAFQIKNQPVNNSIRQDIYDQAQFPFIMLGEDGQQIQRCSIKDREEKNLKRKPKKTDRSRDITQIYKRCGNYIQEEPLFFQKLTTRPLGRTNIYLQKAILVPYHVNSQPVLNAQERQKLNVRNSQVYREKDKFQSGFRQEPLQLSDGYFFQSQQQQYNYIPEEQQDQLQLQYSRSEDNQAQPQLQQKIEQAEPHICERSDWNGLQFASLLKKQQKINDEKEENQTNLPTVSSNSDLTASQKKPFLKKKQKTGLFSQLVKNLKVKKQEKADLLARPAFNTSVPKENPYKLEKHEQQKINLLYEPDTSKKKRKSYYQELQEKKKAEPKWNSKPLKKKIELKRELTMHIGEQESPKRKRSYYEKQRAEKEALQIAKWKATDKDASKATKRKISYVKPPTPKYKRKSYYDSLEKGPQWKNTISNQ